MDPPPPPSSSSSYASFPILAITILGILTTSILLLSYYLFLTRCRLSSAAPPLRRARATHAPLHPAERRGLDPYIISILPIVKFPPLPSAAFAAATAMQECAICLAELRGDDALKLLPDCSHAFHIDCVDTWLQSSTNCPLCRTNVTAPFKHPTEHRERDHVRGKSKNKIVGSMGDECIDVAREKDERFYVQPMRRSLSMDSSSDRQLILSVREMLKEKQFSRGEGSSSGGGGGSGRVRRPFFSFGSGRSSRSAVLPVDIV